MRSGCIALSRESKDTLKGKDLQTLLNILYSLIVYLFSASAMRGQSGRRP
jgi:hypothetical protein